MLQSAPFNFRRIIIWLGRLVLAAFSSTPATPSSSVRTDAPRLPPKMAAYTSRFRHADRFLPDGVRIGENGRAYPSVRGNRHRPAAPGWLATSHLGHHHHRDRRGLLHRGRSCVRPRLTDQLRLFRQARTAHRWTVFRDGAFLLLAVLMTVFAYQEARRPHPWTARSEQSSANGRLSCPRLVREGSATSDQATSSPASIRFTATTKNLSS